MSQFAKAVLARFPSGLPRCCEFIFYTPARLKSTARPNVQLNAENQAFPLFQNGGNLNNNSEEVFASI